MKKRLHGLVHEKIDIHPPKKIFLAEPCDDYGCGRDTLMSIAKHYETGESLPEKVYLKLLAAKTFRAGSLSLRQVSVFRLCILLHSCICLLIRGCVLSFICCITCVILR